MKIALTSDTHYGITDKTYRKLEQMLKKMQEQEPDVVLHAGDWGSHKERHLGACMKLFRRFFSDTPIVGVRGNHDLWTEHSLQTLETFISNSDKTFEEYNILNTYFNHQEKVVIVGWNGWYKSLWPRSNDKYHMPQPENGFPINDYMQLLARESFARANIILEKYPTYKKIALTHFSHSYRNDYAEMNGDDKPITQLIDMEVNVICLGHSHIAQDETVHETRILNCGSDYNKPAYVIFEL